MKKYIFILIMLAFSCCTRIHPTIPPDDSPMLMNAVTKSPTDFGAETPVFLFWLASDFADIGNPSVLPYFTAWPHEGIDAYNPEIKTYDTGKKYPDNDAEVYCTGYFPANLTVDDDADTRRWTRLSVPSEDIGKMDIMVAPEHITGKSTAHFDTKTPEDPLVFIHAQSKVTFKAKMGTDMAQNRYLRNVKVTVPGKGQFMTALEWKNGRYIASETADSDEYDIVLADPNSTQLDPNQAPRELGYVYIFPDKTSITISVQVEIAENPFFTDSEIVTFEAEVPFNFTDSYGDKLRENDAYEIVLIVNYDSIVLKGRKAEWQEGGGLLIPIYPNI